MEPTEEIPEHQRRYFHPNPGAHRRFCLFYSQSSAEGGMVLAVNTILLQFLNWMSYGVDGFCLCFRKPGGKYRGCR